MKLQDLPPEQTGPQVWRGPAMAAELDRAYRAKKSIAVTGWIPHWMPPPHTAPGRVVGLGSAHDDQAFRFFLDTDAAGGEACGHQGDAVALLDAQLGCTRHRRLAVSECRQPSGRDHIADGRHSLCSA